MEVNFNSLDEFIPFVSSTDSNSRLEIYPKLEKYLKNENSNLECENLLKLIEHIILWINSSIFKISLNGLNIIKLLIQKLTDQSKIYIAEGNILFSLNQ